MVGLVCSRVVASEDKGRHGIKEGSSQSSATALSLRDEMEKSKACLHKGIASRPNSVEAGSRT